MQGAVPRRFWFGGGIRRWAVLDFWDAWGRSRSASKCASCFEDMAMGYNLWRSHFGVDEDPFATYFDVHQGYRVLQPYHPMIFGEG